jgi:hypothetical protein
MAPSRPPSPSAADQAEGCHQPRLLGIPSRQAGSALSLPISRTLFSARSDLFLIKCSEWSFPAELDGSFHRSEGCSAINGRGAYGSRFSALLVLDRSQIVVAHQRAAALRCGALRSFINGNIFARRRRGHGRSRPVAILATVDRDSFDCGGSHRADPQSSPRSTEHGGSISAWAPNGNARCWRQIDSAGRHR